MFLIPLESEESVHIIRPVASPLRLIFFIGFVTKRWRFRVPTSNTGIRRTVLNEAERKAHDAINGIDHLTLRARKRREGVPGSMEHGIGIKNVERWSKRRHAGSVAKKNAPVMLELHEQRGKGEGGSGDGFGRHLAEPKETSEIRACRRNRLGTNRRLLPRHGGRRREREDRDRLPETIAFEKSAVAMAAHLRDPHGQLVTVTLETPAETFAGGRLGQPTELAPETPVVELFRRGHA